MNKIRITIVITVFLLFTALGFTAARQFGGYLFVRPAAAAMMVKTRPSQQNILIIRVDDLRDPDLISVWIAFAADYDSAAYVNFKSLYPDPTAGFPPLPVRSLFSLSPNGELSAPFIRWLQENHIEWDGYFLADQYAMEYFGEWMTGAKPQLSAAISMNREQSEKIFREEAQLYRQMCANVHAVDPHRQLLLHWSELIPEHVQTDFDFETAAVGWDKIRSQGKPHCEVIGLP